MAQSGSLVQRVLNGAFLLTSISLIAATVVGTGVVSYGFYRVRTTALPNAAGRDKGLLRPLPVVS